LALRHLFLTILVEKFSTLLLRRPTWCPFQYVALCNPPCILLFHLWQLVNCPTKPLQSISSLSWSFLNSSTLHNEHCNLHHPVIPLTPLVNDLTNNSICCIFENSSKGPTLIYNHLAHPIGTIRSSPSRTIQHSNLVIGEWGPSLYPGQPKYSFHLPLQPSSCLGRITQNHQPFDGSSPSPPLLWHQTHFTNYSIISPHLPFKH